jgi:ABC1 family protein
MQDLLGWNHIVSLPAILLVAWLAGRLLGVSRGWPATVVAGLVGWLAALALSLAIAEGDPRAPGFGRNLWVFAIVFKMSAAVWIELLAKPGALARAQTSLVSLPRPIRAVRRSGQRVGRYAQITRIAVKHGFGPSLGLGRPQEEDEIEPGSPTARRLRLALEECGGMFVKLGQLLSTRADLVPPSVVAELSRLQDQVTPAPQEEIDKLLEAELGRPVAEAFSEFDPEPIAAASIGQAIGRVCGPGRRWSSRSSGLGSPRRSSVTCWSSPSSPGRSRPVPPRLPPAWPATTRSMSRSSTGSCRPHGSCHGMAGRPQCARGRHVWAPALRPARP